MALEIFGVPVILDFTPPMSSTEVDERLDRIYELDQELNIDPDDQEKSGEQSALWSELDNAGMIDYETPEDWYSETGGSE